MLHSTERILVTHTGSLPRPRQLIDMMLAENEGRPVDPAEYEDKLLRAVHDIVRRQMDLGVDVVDDGELSKRGFAVYAHQRLDGLTPTGRVRVSPWDNSRESQAFPEHYGHYSPVPGAKPNPSNMQMACTGPIAYKAQERVVQDLANLKAAVEEAGAAEAFVPAISPCDVAGNQENEYYKSDEELLFAIAEALSVEYRAIVDAGFLLQIDDPLLINYYVKNPDLSVDQCRAWAEGQIEAINHALRDIPEDRVRYHTCYGINMGPRVHDMEMKDYIDIVLKIRAGAFSFEASNPRHEHEWKIWEDVEAARRQAHHPRRHHPVVGGGGAPRAHRPAPRTLRRRSRPRERHRRQRLRLRHPGPGSAGNPSRHRLGQVPGHVGGGEAGERAVVGVRMVS